MNTSSAAIAPTPTFLANRTTFAFRAFLLSFFSFFTVGLGTWFVVIPGVRETLEAFDIHRVWQPAYFAAAQLYWALCAWFCARLVLERRFYPFDALLPCVDLCFARGLIRWLPRLVGLGAAWPMAIALFRAPSGSLPLWLRFVPLAVGAVFLAFVVFRRSVFPEFVHYSVEPTGVEYGYKRFDRINWRGRVLLMLLMVLPFVVFGVLAYDPRLVARTLSTPALALFAFGSWNLWAGFALIYVPLSRGHAAATIYPLLLAALFSAWVENHNTPIGPPPTLAARRVDSRRTLLDQWTKWKTALDSSTCGGGPVYLVAAEGGASRAAFWTAELLSRTEQQFRANASAGKPSCFARRIFAVSGVSGGSLGAATFVSLLADEQARGAVWRSLSDEAAAFLENDMTAPLTGYLLFPDLVQRFLPAPVYRFDRSHGLEDIWTADWADLERTWTAGSRAPVPNWFGSPIEDLYADGRADVLPSLFLNTTRVADGRRVLQSNVSFTPDDTYDILSSDFLTGGLTLADAVHNSARFLYVSPAGLVWRANASTGGQAQAARWGYLVDGGYFENSGAATLVSIIRQLPEDDRWRLSIILISNTPSDGRTDYVCDDGSLYRSTTPDASSFLIEATAPPVALYNTSNARAHAADMAAARALDAFALDHTFELRLPAVRNRPAPPMTWFVGTAVGSQMISYIDDPRRVGATRLADNLEAIRSGSPAPCWGLNEQSTVR